MDDSAKSNDVPSHLSGDALPMRMAESELTGLISLRSPKIIHLDIFARNSSLGKLRRPLPWSRPRPRAREEIEPEALDTLPEVLCQGLPDKNLRICCRAGKHCLYLPYVWSSMASAKKGAQRATGVNLWTQLWWNGDGILCVVVRP